MNTTVQGEPIDLLTIALTLADVGRYHVNRDIRVEPDEVREWLGSDVTNSTVKAVNKFVKSRNPDQLASAVQSLDLPREDVGEAMEVVDDNIKVLRGDSKRPGTFEYEYIPDLIEDVGDATVYMCKSVNGDKAMMAWDLNDDNAIVKVSDYDTYSVLGWEKLKKFPHGSNQIRDQYGDELSDEVLDVVAASDSGNSNSSSTKGSNKSHEQLTLNIGNKHHQRASLSSSKVRDQLVDAGELEVLDTSKLVLFPTGTERNLSDNWWIAGSCGDETNIAIANCNKATYEYLQDLGQVYHADEYIEAAEEYEVITSDGKKELGELEDYVVYTTTIESYPRMTHPEVLDHLPEQLAEMCNGRWRAPDLDGDETIVVVSDEQAFEVRPILRESGDVLYTDYDVRDMGDEMYNVGNEYLIYAKARLGNWDWDSPELEAFEEQCFSLDMDNGGFELVETLARLHDRGEPFYSETPQARWA